MRECLSTSKKAPASQDTRTARPWACGLLTALACLAFAPAALAQTPTIPVQGLLRTVGGGPVADGNYVLTLALYEDAVAPDPAWKEIHVTVPVQGGGFFVQLGTADKLAPIPADFFDKHKDAWLGVRVASDPELPRQRLARLPYASHASTADKLAGKLAGDQIVPGSLPASAAAFGFAGSDSKGGPALDLKCTGCVAKEHLAAGVLDAKNVAFAAGAQQTTVQAQLGALVDVLKVSGLQLGIAKKPGNLCAVDIGSDGGALCIDAEPAFLLRVAADEGQMQQFAKDGQLVYRNDDGRAWLRVKGKWRELQFKAQCGDGAIDPPEQCDDGSANANAPDKCRTTCLLPACGDAIVDGGEQCDDGKANAFVADKCRPTCAKPKCGDGVVDGGEDCDDSNTANGDGCSATCKTCGDGTCQPAKGETWQTCAADCPKLPDGTTQDNPAPNCMAAYDAGSKQSGVYWLKWSGLASPIQVYCNQTADFGTGKIGGWMAYCNKAKSISGSTCGTSIPWSAMKNVDYLAHVQYSPQADWWLLVEVDSKVTNVPKACNARMRVKSDIGNWGKVDSGWMNNLTWSPPCGGSGGCWWGNQSSCDNGGIHLRSDGGGYQSVDTMANGWTQITHGGGLGALGGYVGGKHTSFGAGGTASAAADWEGYVR